jgi:membrane protein
VDDARHVALNRLISVAVVLTGFMVFSVLCILVIFAPLVFGLIERWTDIRIPLGVDVLRYILAAAVLAASLYGMHRFLPSRSMRGLRLWPGIVASVVIWAVVATGLSVYLAYSPSYAVTYGALAGVIVTLLFFYLTGLSLIFGAQVNAAVNSHRLGAASGPDAQPGAGG